jgi:hypothetical protein
MACSCTDDACEKGSRCMGGEGGGREGARSRKMFEGGGKCEGGSRRAG